MMTSSKLGLQNYDPLNDPYAGSIHPIDDPYPNRIVGLIPPLRLHPIDNWRRVEESVLAHIQMRMWHLKQGEQLIIERGEGQVFLITDTRMQPKQESKPDKWWHWKG